MIKIAIYSDDVSTNTILDNVFLEYFPKIDHRFYLDPESCIDSAGQRDILVFDIDSNSLCSSVNIQQMASSFRKLIVLSATDNFLMKAFELEAIGYLLKPLSPKDIVTTMHNGFKIIEREKPFEELSEMLAITQTQ